ncbi:FkbM family methyltransferase [Azospirillum sp. ST 5-10]|uniref:FkbM family methyltransferase n=1 Tax=unclassified Azospirillum TaxID=2630922 RepID=UPI003F4A0C18
MYEFNPQAWFEVLAATPNRMEAIIEMTYRALLRNGDTVVDCGANAGRHTRPMADAVGLAGKVFAVEALPDMAESLRNGYAPFPQVAVINRALTSNEIHMASPTVEFQHARRRAAMSGIRRRHGLTDEDDIVSVTVPTTTLDDLIAPDVDISFMKLDLEGGEFHTLIGAQRILTTSKPILVFEVGRSSAAATYGYTKEDFFGFFSSVQYEIRDFYGRPSGPAEWNEPSLPWYSWAYQRDDKRMRHFFDRIYRHIVAAEVADAAATRITA